MTNKSNYQAVVIGNKYCVIAGVQFGEIECRELGCDFPNCANVVEEYERKDELLAKHPDIEFIDKYVD